MKKITLGSGAGYWGVPFDLPKELVEKANLDYLGLELLAELSMSLLQRMKLRDPSKGYVPDLIEIMKIVLPHTTPKGTKIITNGGGTNPGQAAQEIAKIIQELDLAPMKIGIIEGDDILDKLDHMLDRGVELINLDTGEKDIRFLRDRVVSAHAYIGSELIIDALKEGADIVIGGRLSDSALYVGPIMYELGLSFDSPDWDKIGAALTVGHIIECGEWVTGGASNFWRDNKEPWNIGMPIAEFYENGEAVITKTPDSGGQVTVGTIKEHLVYETHNPERYLMPDGVANLTTLKLEEEAKDRIRVSNMTGSRRPDLLKVQVGYDDGYIAEIMMIVPWPEAITKVKLYENIIRKRFEKWGMKPRELRFDWIGINSVHGSVAPIPEDEDTVNEIGFRCAAKFNTKKEAYTAKRFVMGGAFCSGPVGTAFGAPTPERKIIGLWPTLVPREEVKLTLTMKEVG
jgi:hypothetical protein